MIKRIINGIIIILCMILFIEAVAHIFGLLGQIILGVLILAVPLAYALSNTLGDETS